MTALCVCPMQCNSDILVDSLLFFFLFRGSLLQKSSCKTLVFFQCDFNRTMILPVLLRLSKAHPFITAVDSSRALSFFFGIKNETCFFFSFPSGMSDRRAFATLEKWYEAQIDILSAVLVIVVGKNGRNSERMWLDRPDFYAFRFQFRSFHVAVKPTMVK